MEAYAIFAGGGVKGAAFAGCLVEAATRRIEFLGYGGASAGSLVALLASIGYTPSEIKRVMVEELDYCQFLGDGAALLKEAIKLRDDVVESSRSWKSIAGLAWDYWKEKPRFKPLRLIQHDLGLYSGNHLIDTVRDYITRRNGYEDLRTKSDITFSDLHTRGAKPLEIIASDLQTSRAAVFSRNHTGYGDSVLNAILASTCYPFLFHPVKQGVGHLVDGGLSSNLPVFLFDKERQINRRPIIAFDLVVPARPARPTYKLHDFLGDLVSTALEAGNALLVSSTERVYHVPVPVPSGIDTLKFDLSREDKERLFSAGFEATSNTLSRQLPQTLNAYSPVQVVQAAFIEPFLMESVLAAYAREVERGTGCTNARAYVMLPTSEDRQMVVYQNGMRGAPDMAWNIGIRGGPSGRVRGDHKSVLVEWQRVRDDPRAYGMEEGEVSQIAPGRQMVYCVPVYEFRRPVAGAEAGARPLIATLSVDTDSPVENSGWHHQNRINPALEVAGALWAGVVSKLLS